MVLLIFCKASDTSFRTSFHKSFKRCNSKNYDYIANGLSGIMANHLKYHSIYSVERIRQQHFTHSILKFCKDSSPMLCKRQAIFKRSYASFSKKRKVNLKFCPADFDFISEFDSYIEF